MKAVRAFLFAGVCACASAQPMVPAPEAATYTETVLHTFLDDGGGAGPGGGVIKVNGTLYGTTGSGGTYGGGTVFSLDLNTGVEKDVYSFCSQQNCADGDGPQAMLIDVNGVLYGTTFYGGSSLVDCSDGFDPPGCGTVFALNPGTGAENTVYTFCSQENCADGAYPFANLINVKGRLYGTTYWGGGTACNNLDGPGCGTAYSVDPGSGAETVLHAFCSQQNCADGIYPTAGLIHSNGVLYGATTGGSTVGGTLFSINVKTGAEKVLYTFCAQSIARTVQCPSGR